MEITSNLYTAKTRQAEEIMIQTSEIASRLESSQPIYIDQQDADEKERWLLKCRRSILESDNLNADIFKE